jgi:hypothetical protein
MNTTEEKFTKEKDKAYDEITEHLRNGGGVDVSSMMGIFAYVMQLDPDEIEKYTGKKVNREILFYNRAMIVEKIMSEMKESIMNMIASIEIMETVDTKKINDATEVFDASLRASESMYLEGTVCCVGVKIKPEAPVSERAIVIAQHFPAFKKATQG